MSRVIVALNRSRTFTGVLTYARFLAGRLAADPALSPTTPPLPVFEEHIADLHAAIVDAHTRAHGTSSAQTAAFAVVTQDMTALRGHIQARVDASPGDARALVEAAGMDVKQTAGPKKPQLKVKQGSSPGTAHAYARAEGTRASYDWEYSLDGEHWTRVEPTLRADKLFTGLPERTRVWFRYRAVTRAGVGAFCDPVSLLVD